MARTDINTVGGSREQGGSRACIREGFWDGFCVHHPSGVVASEVTFPLGHKMTANSNGSHQVFSSRPLASLAMYPFHAWTTHKSQGIAKCPWHSHQECLGLGTLMVPSNPPLGCTGCGNQNLVRLLLCQKAHGVTVSSLLGKAVGYQYILR